MVSDLAIDLKHVAKIYKGRVHALQGVEMHVRRGEVFGLLGPNGAGKSTLVKIMMTVVRPTREGTVLGATVGDKATLARVGYLPENHRFPRYLTGRQTLEFFAAMAKVDRRTARRRRAGELLETVGMKTWADRRISTYSKGMMQRIGLAQALMNDPELVLLDEPTDGVDPLGRREIMEVMCRMREQGKTVFINSHALSELESICDRVAILVKGMVAMQGTIDELTLAKQRYEIEFVWNDPHMGRQKVLAAVPAGWKQSEMPTRTLERGMLPAGQWIELEGPILRIGITDPGDVQPILDALRSQALTIRRVQSMRVSLEDLFFATVTDPVSGQRSTLGAHRGRITGNGEPL